LGEESAHRTCGSAARAFQRAAARRKASRQSEAARPPGQRTGARRLRPRDGRPDSPVLVQFAQHVQTDVETKRSSVGRRLQPCLRIEPPWLWRGAKRETCFLAAPRMAGASAPAAETAALGCAMRLTRFVPNARPAPRADGAVRGRSATRAGDLPCVACQVCSTWQRRRKAARCWRHEPLRCGFAVTSDSAAQTLPVCSCRLPMVEALNVQMDSCSSSETHLGEESAHRSSAHPCAACTLRQRDAQRRADGAAEAAGQRTAAHRVLRRVRPLVS